MDKFNACELIQYCLKGSQDTARAVAYMSRVRTGIQIQDGDFKEAKLFYNEGNSNNKE